MLDHLLGTWFSTWLTTWFSTCFSTCLSTCLTTGLAVLSTLLDKPLVVLSCLSQLATLDRDLVSECDHADVCHLQVFKQLVSPLSSNTPESCYLIKTSFNSTSNRLCAHCDHELHPSAFALKIQHPGRTRPVIEVKSNVFHSGLSSVLP